MGGPCDIGENGDKMPDFWIFQFIGDDGEAVKVAQTEDMNRVMFLLSSAIRMLAD